MTSAFPMSCVTVSCSIQQQAHIFPSPSFGHLCTHRSPSYCLWCSSSDSIPGEFSAFLTASAWSGNVFVSPKLLVPISTLCRSLTRSPLFIHEDLLAFLPECLLSSLDCSWAQGQQSLEINQLSGRSYPQGLTALDSNNEIFEKAKVCSSEIQYSQFISCPPQSSQDPEHYHLVITTSDAALELHIPNEPLLVCDYEVQKSTSPWWLLCHLD